MKTIEQACLLGHVQEIDKLLEQSSPIDITDDFFSAIGCCIEYQNLKIFTHLLQKTEFQDLIISQQTRLKTLIIQNDSPQFMKSFNDILEKLGVSNSFFCQQIELPLQEFQPLLLPLDADEQLVISNLTQYYQTILANHPLEYHYQQLKNFLAKQYQDNPAQFEDTPLPLHWEAFHQLSNENNYSFILKSYHQHTIHTAWRYLLTNNPWRSQENDILIKHNPKDMQWYIILIWYAAKDKSFSEENSTAHLKQFTENLAALNRSGNTDDLTGDKPLPSKDIRRILLKSLNHHPLAIILDDALIEKEEKLFIEKKWFEIFSQYSIEQFLQIKYHWEKIQLHPNLIESCQLLKKFDLSDNQIAEFNHQMSLKWGNRWKANHSRQRMQPSSLLCIHWKNLFDSMFENHSYTQQSLPHQTLQFFKPHASTQEAQAFEVNIVSINFEN